MGRGSVLGENVYEGECPSRAAGGMRGMSCLVVLLGGFPGDLDGALGLSKRSMAKPASAGLAFGLERV